MRTPSSNRIGSARRLFALAFLALFAIVLAYNALFSFSYGYDWNYRNVSVDTRVNITQSKPEVLYVRVDSPVTLNAGATTTIACNATIRDYNGAGTISNVTAMFWDNRTVGVSDPDDNNNHYTNTSCTLNVSYGTYYSNFTCYFPLQYYANNGSRWVCNVTATDTYQYNASVNSSNFNFSTATINTLLALNVTPLIDYGNMAVGDTSAARQANVTNFGNTNINISVKGYGNRSGDGLAFLCQFGNITIANERFSLNESGDYLVDYLPLSSAFQQIPTLTLPQQTNDTVPVINQTYWRLYVPPNPFGQCNGTVVFQAELSS